MESALVATQFICGFRDIEEQQRLALGRIGHDQQRFRRGIHQHTGLIDQTADPDDDPPGQQERSLYPVREEVQ